jgi:predicted transcriptional regulator
MLGVRYFLKQIHMTLNGKDYKVRDIMREVVTIQENVELKEALEALVKGKSNIAVVVDANGSFVGGVSTLDIIRAVLPDYMEKDQRAAHFADNTILREDTLKAATLPIADFVDKDDATVSPDANLLEATVIASVDGLGRIVVVDENNKPVGLLTRTEIKQVLAAFLDIENELQDFCAGSDC